MQLSKEITLFDEYYMNKKIWVKVEKKEPKSVWTILKNYFLKIWKITMGTLYVKKMILFFK